MNEHERKRRFAAVDAELAQLYRADVLQKQRIAACRQQLAHLDFDAKVSELEARGVPSADAYRRAARENPALYAAATPVHRS